MSVAGTRRKAAASWSLSGAPRERTPIHRRDGRQNNTLKVFFFRQTAPLAASSQAGCDSDPTLLQKFCNVLLVVRSISRVVAFVTTKPIVVAWRDHGVATVAKPNCIRPVGIWPRSVNQRPLSSSKCTATR